MPTLVAAFDSFRDSLTAIDACAAACDAARSLGWTAVAVPMADGGEGTLDALGGPNRSTRVSDPLGRPVDAPWQLQGHRAVIEMSRASGLALVGGAEANDPVAASTRGTGELIRAALDEGATQILVGLGGSATTDGGAGVLEVVPALPDRVELVILCDVRTPFVDAARVFGPQKGATPDQVVQLTARLEGLAERFGPAATLPGSGAAGGLAGGLAFLGGQLRSGFDVVAEAAGLREAVAEADRVVTGEGRFDPTSWEGKVVGGVWALAPDRTTIVAGQVTEPHPAAVSLLDRFGERAWTDPAGCIREIVREVLRSR